MWVLRGLREAGHEALFAGGCVRDRQLGRPSTDYDVATDATPKQVAKLFPQVLLIGAQFGVAMVVHHGQTVEVATFRSDSAYTDGRRPDKVTFSSAKEDALRRDFTINGMFYDPLADQVIDYVGGMADLAAGVIRTIGDPDQRFSEDYLRLIRAVRFSVRLGFGIDTDTEAAIVRHAEKITGVSGERILEELRKMLSEPKGALALWELHRLGLMQHLLPALFDSAETWGLAIERAEAVAGCADPTLTLAALLVELDSATISRVIRHWGASNEVRDAILWMAKLVDAWREAPDWPLAQFKRLISHPQFNRLCLIWLAVEKMETGQTDYHRRVRERFQKLDPMQIAPVPLLSGQDLLEMGVPEGPELGQVLEQVYDAQLNEVLSDRKSALEMARGLIGQRDPQGA